MSNSKCSKFLKILLFVIIGIAVLVCAFKIAAVLHNDPPAKTETITDEKEYLSVNRYVKNTMKADLEGSLPNQIPNESTAAKYYYNYVCGLLGDPSYIINLKCQFNDVQDMSNEYQRLVQLKPESIKKTSNEEIFVFKCHPVDIERYFDDKILDGTILCFEIVVFNEDEKSIEYLTAEIQDSYGKPDIVTSVLNKVR